MLLFEILESKAQDSSGDIRELESKIDKLVYRLYNLINEEIESMIFKDSAKIKIISTFYIKSLSKDNFT